MNNEDTDLLKIQKILRDRDERVGKRLARLEENEAALKELAGTSTTHNALTKLRSRLQDLETRVTNADRVYTALGVTDGNWKNAERVALSLNRRSSLPEIFSRANPCWRRDVKNARGTVLYKAIPPVKDARFIRLCQSMAAQILEMFPHQLQDLAEVYAERHAEEFIDWCDELITGTPDEVVTTTPTLTWESTFLSAVADTDLNPDARSLLHSAIKNVPVTATHQRIDEEWILRGEQYRAAKIIELACLHFKYGTNDLDFFTVDGRHDTLLEGAWDITVSLDKDPPSITRLLNELGLEGLWEYVESEYAQCIADETNTFAFSAL